MLAVERDVKPQNMNFAKVEKGGGGGVCVRLINTVSKCQISSKGLKLGNSFQICYSSSFSYAIT